MFHYVLGVSITQWSNVENLIANVMLCFYSSAAKNRLALSVGYFSLEGFRSKLLFADGLINRALAGDMRRAKWQELSERARTLSFQRNRLAHWNMERYWHRRAGLRLVLSPWVYPKPKKRLKNPVPPRGALSIREIYRSSMAFSALAISLENFLHLLSGRTAPHAASAEQAGDPPTVENLMRQIHAVCGVQHQSSREKRREEDAKNAAASLLVPLPSEPVKEN